jgi:Tfp pilus assembly protein PilF
MLRSVLTSVLVALALAGCTNPSAKGPAAATYRTINADPLRDTDAAARHTQAGLVLLDKGQLNPAAEEFNKALTADVDYGPAHNNLGKVYYRQRLWYKAAWEFEYACNQLPRSAEPRNNLGLVLEESGQLDRAVDTYRQAVALDGSNIQYRANLVRAMVRRGDRTAEVRELLRQVAQQDTRPDWQRWALQQEAGMSDRAE